MKTCKIDGCPLTAASEVMVIPEGADPKRCWVHQPDHILAAERDRRAVTYKQWYEDTQPARQKFYERVKATQELVKG